MATAIMVATAMGMGSLKGVAVAAGQCDPFTRNRGITGEAWQSNLTTDGLMVGVIPTLCDEHG